MPLGLAMVPKVPKWVKQTCQIAHSGDKNLETPAPEITLRFEKRHLETTSDSIRAPSKLPRSCLEAPQGWLEAASRHLECPASPNFKIDVCSLSHFWGCETHARFCGTSVCFANRILSTRLKYVIGIWPSWELWKLRTYLQLFEFWGIIWKCGNIFGIITTYLQLFRFIEISVEFMEIVWNYWILVGIIWNY